MKIFFEKIPIVLNELRGIVLTLVCQANDNGKPKLLIAKTVIGKGIDAVAGTNAAHGEAGVKFVKDAKAAIGLPAEGW